MLEPPAATADMAVLPGVLLSRIPPISLLRPARISLPTMHQNRRSYVPGVSVNFGATRQGEAT